MRIEQLVPSVCSVELDDVIHTMTAPSPPTLPVFAPESMELCEKLSRALFKHPSVRNYPEAQALAFGMRKTEVQGLVEEFTKKNGHMLRVPRGLVFHVPPSNIDTIFIYSWFFSLLAGNRNVVRISERPSGLVETICTILNEVIGGTAGAIRHNTVMIRYGHDSRITAALSAVADVRVIWGGDETIDTVRTIAVSPRCKELTFADRYSWSIVKAAKFLNLPKNEQQEIAHHFYNDVYFFNQMACSSPRIVVWLGEVKECTEASTTLWRWMREQLSGRGRMADTALSLRKITFMCEAILQQPVSGVVRDCNELTVLQLSDLNNFKREHCGGGLLFQYYTEWLEEVVACIGQKDQTLTYFGFSRPEIEALAHQLNGKGLDRIVPIGQALRFNRYWDGYDLLAELTKHVYIE